MRQSGQQVFREASEGLGPREIQLKTPEEEWRKMMLEREVGTRGSYRREKMLMLYLRDTGILFEVLKLGLM